ncbi:peptidoglycan recognition family protein [Acaryochloris sp. IP29b_bin.148]|uniref:N-acetylmuramoyl-L-alanine amidase n=1 Tax=Acaryochloris sp. IP29b_bin.148 TaxID=2969218 RepID=UPI00262FEC94|nr:peptidoglycan recognition family protein [Acaryochloris sp. IP29b_bin.148]
MTRNKVFLTLVLSVTAGLITSAFGFWSVTEKEASSSSSARNNPSQPTGPSSTLNPTDLPQFKPDIVLEDPKAVPPTSPASPVPRPNPAPITPPPPATQLPPTLATSSYPQPREAKADVHPTNYGERFAANVHGQAVQNNWLIVLHETVGSAMSAINTFQTPHPRDEDQVSYHALIFLDGTIVYLVPPEKRAYGAGNSVFVGANGPEAVQTNANLPASVNNFAYHISLETPADGNHNGPVHSGYTEAQYQSLAWLIARTGVPIQRVTTHAKVDRSGERADPRSFDFSKFSAMLQPVTNLNASNTPPQN